MKRAANHCGGIAHERAAIERDRAVAEDGAASIASESAGAVAAGEREADEREHPAAVDREKTVGARATVDREAAGKRASVDRNVGRGDAKIARERDRLAGKSRREGDERRCREGRGIGERVPQRTGAGVVGICDDEGRRDRGEFPRLKLRRAESQSAS